MAPLLLRHSLKLHEFTAFRRRYRVESQPSSKARKNRIHVYIYTYISMSSKKGSPISTFALWRCTKIYIFLNRQLTLKTSISLQSLSRCSTVQYATRIFLFRDIRLQAGSRAIRERRRSTRLC